MNNSPFAEVVRYGRHGLQRHSHWVHLSVPLAGSNAFEELLPIPLGLGVHVSLRLDILSPGDDIAQGCMGCAYLGAIYNNIALSLLRRDLPKEDHID